MKIKFKLKPLDLSKWGSRVIIRRYLFLGFTSDNRRKICVQDSDGESTYMLETEYVEHDEFVKA